LLATSFNQHLHADLHLSLLTRALVRFAESKPNPQSEFFLRR